MRCNDDDDDDIEYSKVNVEIDQQKTKKKLNIGHHCFFSMDFHILKQAINPNWLLFQFHLYSLISKENHDNFFQHF